jgi:hypothetical protein
VLQWLKHAFAVEPAGEVEPDDLARPVVEQVCREVVRRRLTTPMLLVLESTRPLNFVTSQLLHFLSPLISAITDRRGHEHLARFLEHRGSIDWFCRRIEELEREATECTAAEGKNHETHENPQ